MKTLRDVMPEEFWRFYNDVPSYKFLDVVVVEEYSLGDLPL